MPAGLVDYLTLTPEQRKAEYRARAVRAAHDHPEDPAAVLTYLKLLAEEGNMRGSAAEAKGLVALKAPAAMLAEAARALLAAKNYAAARDLLQAAPGSAPLAFAAAVFHTSGPKAGLAELDRVPDRERGGEFFLSRARRCSKPRGGRRKRRSRWWPV